MGKLVVSLDGVVIKEVQIIKDKTTLGRRPYNDIVIDNLAVSGEHAVLQMVGPDVFIEDLNSTNGTYINGKAVKKQLLAHNDTVEIGKYKIKYLVEEGGDYEKTMIMRQGHGAPVPRPGAAGVLADLAAGRQFRLRHARRQQQPGIDQGAQRRRGRARGGADQGGHHGRQTRRAGGLDHQAARRLRDRARRGHAPPGDQRRAADRRFGAAEKR